MAEDGDVGVCVAALVERIDEDWGAGGAVGANEQAARLPQVRMRPGKEGCQGGRVEHPLALQAVRTARARGQESVQLAKGAGLQLAKHGACRRLDPAGAQ